MKIKIFNLTKYTFKDLISEGEILCFEHKLSIINSFVDLFFVQPFKIKDFTLNL